MGNEMTPMGNEVCRLLKQQSIRTQCRCQDELPQGATEKRLLRLRWKEPEMTTLPPRSLTQPLKNDGCKTTFLLGR